MSDDWTTELKSIALHTGGEAAAMWPDDASDEYRAARLALVDAEATLRDRIEAVAAMRRSLPPGPLMPRYEFTEGPRDLTSDGPSVPVTLAELFDDHDELFVYHLMFHPDDDAACPMCSLWIDGLHGVSHHLARRVSFAVIAKAPVGKLRAWGRHRGWHGLRLVSAHETSFAADMGTEGSRGGQWPAVSVFTKRGDEVRHSYTQSADLPDRSQRGIDLLSPVWNVWDLLPSGRGDWYPDNTYPAALRGHQAQDSSNLTR